MKLEHCTRGAAWRLLMEFPFSTQHDVQTAATRLFSQATEIPRLRIRDGQHILARAQDISGVLVWETYQHNHLETMHAN